MFLMKFMFWRKKSIKLGQLNWGVLNSFRKKLKSRLNNNRKKLTLVLIISNKSRKSWNMSKKILMIKLSKFFSSCNNFHRKNNLEQSGFHLDRQNLTIYCGTMKYSIQIHNLIHGNQKKHLFYWLNQVITK